MPIRTIASLAVALLLGLIAVLMVRGVLTSQRAGGPDSAASGMTPVVVAALQIERGVELKPAMLKTVNYPKDAVPAGAFKTVDELTGKSAAARTTLRSMGPNEPVLTAKLSGPGGKVNLSGALTPGMRAVSVKSNDVAGVGGFILPGDRVDVMVTRPVGKGDAETVVTQVLAENALVLGVDQTSDQDADKPLVAKAVTVEVTPDQAQAISLGLAVGQVSLALRQISDDGVLTRRATTVSDLGFGVRKAPAARRSGGAGAAKPVAKQPEVRVTRGVVTSGYAVVGGF
ncbi:Flp pilus assembly protein CpaB [Phenylobacterium sp.]|uniref:Flp pilus assembly protein CpaB n=1 Tax=Phenylobacterium sp. TaxID=1871053 RepID=UPI0027332529|nr:Flp pilus assembly protein CpaB [Phenylobacterium sp.]MDP3852255.1 Flp pilus assembly protein CpaB [Phenylobacterium sp.]